MDNFYVEIHLKSFPVTDYSTFYFFDLPRGLSLAGRNTILLLAEFIYRDGQYKSFTARDMLDSYFAMSLVPSAEWAGIAQVIDENSLWPAVLITAQCWQQNMTVPKPGILAALMARFMHRRWQGKYDILEHQCWLACQKRGFQRSEFDAMDTLREALADDSHPRQQTITLAELEKWMQRGMPVKGRLSAADASTVAEAYSIVHNCKKD
jgi:hypothetical protein